MVPRTLPYIQCGEGTEGRLGESEGRASKQKGKWKQVKSLWYC